MSTIEEPESQSDESNNWDQYSELIQKYESNGDKDVINPYGYVGLYQMGAPALMDAGYVKHTGKWNNQQLNDPDVWTGLNGVSSLDDYLTSADIQTDAFCQYTRMNLRTLLLNGIIKNTSPPNEVYGHLAGSHLLGGTQYSKNSNAVDANNISGLKYYNRIQQHEWQPELEMCYGRR